VVLTTTQVTALEAGRKPLKVKAIELARVKPQVRTLNTRRGTTGVIRSGSASRNKSLKDEP
jgi:hypothetical protein